MLYPAELPGHCLPVDRLQTTRCWPPNEQNPHPHVSQNGKIAVVHNGIIENATVLKAGLEALGGLGAEQVLAVEVLWTPSDERDVFTRDDIMTDYPTLKTL